MNLRNIFTKIKSLGLFKIYCRFGPNLLKNTQVLYMKRWLFLVFFFKWSGLLAINTILHNLVSFIHKTSRKSPLKKAIMKSAFYALALSSTLRYTFQLKEAVQFFPLFQTISKVNILFELKELV